MKPQADLKRKDEDAFVPRELDEEEKAEQQRRKHFSMAWVKVLPEQYPAILKALKKGHKRWKTLTWEQIQKIQWFAVEQVDHGHTEISDDLRDTWRDYYRDRKAKEEKAYAAGTKPDEKPEKTLPQKRKPKDNEGPELSGPDHEVRFPDVVMSELAGLMTPALLFKVYMAYVWHRNWTTGEGWTSQTTMAHELRINRKTFSEHSETLRKAALLETLRRGAFGRSNTWRVVKLTPTNLSAIKRKLTALCNGGPQTTVRTRRSRSGGPHRGPNGGPHRGPQTTA